MVDPEVDQGGETEVALEEEEKDVVAEDVEDMDRMDQTIIDRWV